MIRRPRISGGRRDPAKPRSVTRDSNYSWCVAEPTNQRVPHPRKTPVRFRAVMLATPKARASASERKRVGRKSDREKKSIPARRTTILRLAYRCVCVSFWTLVGICRRVVHKPVVSRCVRHLPVIMVFDYWSYSFALVIYILRREYTYRCTYFTLFTLYKHVLHSVYEKLVSQRRFGNLHASVHRALRSKFRWVFIYLPICN